MDFSSTVNTELTQFVKKYGLDKSSPYLCAVSGGNDSMALLKGLMKAGFTKLIVCHLDHGLRGEESVRDADFVARFCQSNGLELELEKVDLQGETGSMETVARRARISFFSKIASSRSVNKVFLAHHADDVVETALFNLCRGGAGVQSIKECSRVEGMILYRPLLALPKNDLHFFREQHGVDSIIDSSNALPIATRNRMRNEVLPLLDRIMGRKVQPAISRAVEYQQLVESFLSESYPLDAYLDPQGRLYLPTFLPLHALIQGHIMLSYLENEKVPALSNKLIKKAVLLANSTEAPAKVNLPQGKILRRKQKRLFVEK